MSKSSRILRIMDLKPGMDRVSVKVRVLEAHSPKTVQTRRGPRTLSEAIIGDESGRVKVTLWGQKAGQLVEGKAVIIENAFVTSYRGESQLNVGKFGKITEISDDDVPEIEDIPENVPRAPPRFRKPRF